MVPLGPGRRWSGTDGHTSASSFDCHIVRQLWLVNGLSRGERVLACGLDGLPFEGDFGGARERKLALHHDVELELRESGALRNVCLP
jgi:hypothetical protein